MKNKIILLALLVGVMTWSAKQMNHTKKTEEELEVTNVLQQKKKTKDNVELKAAKEIVITNEGLPVKSSPAANVKSMRFKLSKTMEKKVLFTQAEKKKMHAFYTDHKRVEAALKLLGDLSTEPVGKEGIGRIESIDFLEKSLSYRNNQNRSKIIHFIDQFVHQKVQRQMNKTAQKFFVGDQLELLEILAFNQPQEFLYLKQRTTNPRVLKMMSLVEHHATRNL